MTFLQNKAEERLFHISHSKEFLKVFCKEFSDGLSVLWAFAYIFGSKSETNSMKATNKLQKMISFETNQAITIQPNDIAILKLHKNSFRFSGALADE